MDWGFIGFMAAMAATILAIMYYATGGYKAIKQARAAHTAAVEMLQDIFKEIGSPEPLVYDEGMPVWDQSIVAMNGKMCLHVQMMNEGNIALHLRGTKISFAAPNVAALRRDVWSDIIEASSALKTRSA